MRQPMRLRRTTSAAASLSRKTKLTAIAQAAELNPMLPTPVTREKPVPRNAPSPPQKSSAGKIFNRFTELGPFDKR